MRWADCIYSSALLLNHRPIWMLKILKQVQINWNSGEKSQAYVSELFENRKQSHLKQQSWFFGIQYLRNVLKIFGAKCVPNEKKTFYINLCKSRLESSHFHSILMNHLNIPKINVFETIVSNRSSWRFKLSIKQMCKIAKTPCIFIFFVEHLFHISN